MMPERNRPKLLVLTSTYPRWDGDTTPRFVADLCRGLAEEFDVTVLAPASHGAESVERQAGVTVRRYRYAWPSRMQKLADGAILPNLRRNPWLFSQVPPLVLAQAWASWRLMQRERFDAIHAHWAVPQGVVAALLKRRFGTPVVTTTHGGDIYALRSGAARAIKRWALRSSDRVTAVSSSLKREVEALGIDAGRIDVLPMGVDASTFTPAARSESLRRELNPSGGPVLLFVGRLAEKKGARYAIEAMPAILREHPDARLVLVGDGPERQSLSQLASALGIEASVTLMGAVANGELPEYYRVADLLVGPSIVADDGDREGVPVVFAEAMASGCPVVTTDAGGITDAVIRGETGVMVAQRNSDDLAATITSLLTDNGRRFAMARRCVNHARTHLAHERLHKQYSRLIRGMIRKRGRS
jgi:glycosyltransferase involved in cell wall biosynthesis